MLASMNHLLLRELFTIDFVWKIPSSLIFAKIGLLNVEVNSTYLKSGCSLWFSYNLGHGEAVKEFKQTSLTTTLSCVLTWTTGVIILGFFEVWIFRLTVTDKLNESVKSQLVVSLGLPSSMLWLPWSFTISLRWSLFPIMITKRSRAGELLKDKTHRLGLPSLHGDLLYSSPGVPSSVPFLNRIMPVTILTASHRDFSRLRWL